MGDISLLLYLLKILYFCMKIYAKLLKEVVVNVRVSVSDLKHVQCISNQNTYFNLSALLRNIKNHHRLLELTLPERASQSRALQVSLIQYLQKKVLSEPK